MVATLPPTVQQQQPFYVPPTRKNLKTVPVNEDVEKLARWRCLQGLSEKAIITTPGVALHERSEQAVTLAYRRCEYVTKLFSKTFYMGTSLMRPDARQHVWAIYAWCRRTDDIVDSPRALMNQDVLSKDLQEWGARLDGIWRGEPHDLFDLAMVDTLKVRTAPHRTAPHCIVPHCTAPLRRCLDALPKRFIQARQPANLSSPRCRRTRGCQSSHSAT